jgi:hypothetical protein
MRTTLIIDDALPDKARKLSGVGEKTAVVRAGLEALIARESARRLAALGGTERVYRPARWAIGQHDYASAAPPSAHASRFCAFMVADWAGSTCTYLHLLDSLTCHCGLSTGD